MKILLLGEEAASLQLFRMLRGGPHELIGVMTSPPAEGSEAASLWKVAESQGCAVWPATLVKDPGFPEIIRAEEVEILLNIHSLVVLPTRVLETPRFGCFNLHPAPLPRYAGLNSVSWAIYRGELSHGVTLHRMTPEIDAGPIVYQALFEIAEDATAISVFVRCVRDGLPLISKLLETAAANPKKVPLQPQDLSQREYFGRGAPHDGWISWSSPARHIVNFVRACDFLPFRSPWGHPRTNLNGEELSILKASRTHQPCDCAPGTVGDPTDSGVPVAALDEWVSLHDVMMAGRPLKSTEVLTAGSRLQDSTTERPVRTQRARFAVQQ
jgi:methionyl-tRNA formyltransferase